MYFWTSHFCFASECLYVGLSVRWHISEIALQTSRNFLYVLPLAVARYTDDRAIYYALPVLWMTSCFYILGHMTLGRRQEGMIT